VIKVDYYINSRTGRRKKIWKVLLYVIAYLLVFALSFLISYRLVAGTEAESDEMKALKEEVASLTSQLAEKEEIISSMELQIRNIQTQMAEQEAETAVPTE
jgi:sensor histidine kinase YesM